MSTVAESCVPAIEADFTREATAIVADPAVTVATERRITITPATIALKNIAAFILETVDELGDIFEDPYEIVLDVIEDFRAGINS